MRRSIRPMRWTLALCLCAAGCAATPAHPVAVHPPPPQPFCTRTLGLAQCFANPAALPDHPADLGDTPLRNPPPPLPF
jgi:hypothetical protein